ncbi:MAG: c-type cytochrome [Aequorivita antarctica]
MRLFLFFIVILLGCSCKSEKKSNEAMDIVEPKRAELSFDSQIFLGNRLFSEKTCITCHDVNRVKKAPSVKEIMAVYKEKNGDIVAFLKGNAQPIVDTTATQVAIMQKNIDGFLKKITDEELNSLSIYMLHIDKLYPE